VRSPTRWKAGASTMRSCSPARAGWARPPPPRSSRSRARGEGGAPDPAKLLEAEERIARLGAELAEALEELREVQRLHERLSRHDSHNARWAALHARVHDNLNLVLRTLGREVEAIQEQVKAARLRLVEDARRRAMRGQHGHRAFGHLIDVVDEDRPFCFQIADDVLDYASDADTLGKNLGDDLAEGKATLPLIHAIAHSDATTQAALRAAIEHGDVEAMPAVVAAIRATGGLDYSRGRAMEFADAAEAAIADLPPNAVVDALRGLARYSVTRDR